MPNTSGIKKRIKSITSTQKITKAMKLVSLSKLQRYRDQMSEFKDYYEAVTKVSEQFIHFDEAIIDDTPRLYLVVMPDLGLCSAYTQGLARKLLEVYREDDMVISLGTQAYDFLQTRGVNIINPEVSSERIELHDIIKTINPFVSTHQIVAIIPEYENAMTLEFKLHILNTKSSGRRDDVIYEPSFEEASEMMIKQSLMSLVKFTYLTSKVSEHTTRRIAMEKATDSAQDMIDDLGRKYNRVRQEAITQEISEIVSGMEVS
ncbi:F0F1 ATP synthase subunit gamma [Erysipelothrix rhusiopathiae]|uniref:F0F1 ATP synthase subunit gamma n=1 Tax=Erysipelothrix rhusiopathiae TaxID=1648 RepID=UPI000F45DA76|nr:FoF1 ATP synthase subunit gamma [Erysipelothrix rhusiopathiae]MDE8038139.1 F0F1 ATP synthase subunit gamma [Erysipelothrix rhusiopathiae]MDE8258839.1 F0F1 ATP synthase subunit gamma [Erysipelothrix rhusiopathiae]MDE8260453.1 F0F1 ATP synthase subunit gamma [Erysipelothrix rhusiopathiae]MDE8273477.1 F0F1 ATP synthase subunit gamma [Erysipelothrix rhusiopathiae]MDE8275462.1 F0F1 ATP synthase subunit gamma [Erysipelothrix rhusiopathiae]